MSLRVIPTGVHGTIDYLASGANLILPWLLRLEDHPPAARTPRLAGWLGVGYSLITDYELGAVKVMPMTAQLALDAAKGHLSASSPWLFGLMGTADRLVVATSKTD